MKRVVWGLVLLLVVIHQDFWFWDDDRLIFGFVPITLFFHACISVAAGVVWLLAVQFAWPQAQEEETQRSVAELATAGRREGGHR